MGKKEEDTLSGIPMVCPGLKPHIKRTKLTDLTKPYHSNGVVAEEGVYIDGLQEGS